MRKEHQQHLAGQMARGNVILFTGAGFSRAATNHAGNSMPLGRELAELLWSIAFPSEAFDSEATLADVYDAAASMAGNRVGEMLRRELTVKRDSVPELYQYWFAMPWYRMYTLNLDDLDEKTQARFSLPRQVAAISALTTEAPPPGDKLLSVHLNGRVAEYPAVTFTDRQYGERAAAPDIWYRTIANDLASHVVLFVGTDLNEPPLWQQIELRRMKGLGARELRPRSYLVTPSLSSARRTVLERYNVEWVEMGIENFTYLLESMDASRIQGLAILSAREEDRARRSTIQPVSELRSIPLTDPQEFLLGREPHWADVVTGFAVEREFELSLAADFDGSDKRIAVITGTAGSGKSTTLMRLAVQYETEGKGVFFLPLETGLSLGKIRESVRRFAADILVIDDVDAFGSSAGPLLLDLCEETAGLRVLVGVRSSRYDRLEVSEEGTELIYEVTVPPLEDSDIDLLLDALTRAKRLGNLRELSREKQVKAFRDLAGRQLIVAMIEATSGQRFDERIESECADLSSEKAFIYAATALTTSFRQHVTRDELLLAIGGEINLALNAVKTLIDRRLLVQDGERIRTRHRVIADRALDYYQRHGQLAVPIQGLIYVMGSKVTETTPRYSRERSLLVSLLNHEFLIRRGLNASSVRELFDSVEDLLSWDFHYWLQRGSYEVERGDIQLAKNFLEQAHRLAPDDYMVQTEWAYMTIKRAAGNPTAEDAQVQVDEAIGELEDAIEQRGYADSYPYHVLGSQGLAWARRAPMDLPVRRQFLARLLANVKEGRRRHVRNKELRQLEKDVEEAYLMTAVAGD